MTGLRKGIAVLIAGAGLFAAAPASAFCAPVTVYFDWNSAELNAESREALERLALSLAWKRPDLDHILLTSHTDASGSAAANRALALRRAEAVRQLLAEQEVPPDLIRVAPLAAADPRVPTAPNVREPRNRRVELLIQMSADAQARQLQDGRPIC